MPRHCDRLHRMLLLVAVSISVPVVAEAARPVISGGESRSADSASRHTYYVATNGNDSNTGSQSNPWQTLQYGASKLLPGDTLNVGPGTYNTGVICGWDPNGLYGPVNGAAGNPVTIQADPATAGGTVIVQGANPYTGSAFDFEPRCSYITIKGFTIKDPNGVITRQGIKVSGPGNKVLNNLIDGVSGFGIFTAAANDVLIQGNEVKNTKGANNLGHGIYISYRTTHPVIQGNYIHNNGDTGLHVNSQGYPTTKATRNAFISGNIFANNGAKTIAFDGVQDSTIVNNLIYGYDLSAILLYQMGGGGPSTGNIIVNNTMISDRVNSNESAIRLLNGAKNTTILNNIVYDSRSIFLQASNDSLPGLVSDYNLYDLGARFRNDNTYAFKSFSQWQAGGKDAHSVLAATTQMFVKPAGNDYHLAAGSPAIDKGTATKAPSTDLAGTPRPQGAGYDIGAYEYK